MRIAFIDEKNTVQNVIIATGMNDDEKKLFLDEAHARFGSVWMLEIEDDDTRVYIGGTWDNGHGFMPLPSPTIVIDGTSEVVEEPIGMLEEPQPEPLPEPTESV